MKRLCIFACCVLSVLISRAQDSRTVFNFLRLPVSAHVAALGGDNISIADGDATLVFHNPALSQPVPAITGWLASVAHGRCMGALSTTVR